jgi:hypothetical protein
MQEENEIEVDLKAYVPYALFTYAIDHLEQKDKVRFYYDLKGRDGKSGIMKACRIEQLGRTVLLVPKDQESAVEQFLKKWNCKSGRRLVWAAR